MFCVIYSFRIKKNQEKSFLIAWEELTKLIYQYEGSLGSRIHLETEDHYIAYAQWPNRERWENSGDQLPPEADKWRQQMRDACTNIETLHELEMTSDLLKTEVHNK